METNAQLMLTNPNKAFRRLSVPLILFAIFNALYTFIDLVWASFLGESVITAVLFAIPLFSLIGYFGCYVGQGVNSLMSRFYGANNIGEVKNTFLHGVFACLIFYLLIAIIGFSSLDDFIYFMQLSDVGSIVITYMFPLLLCSGIFIFNMFFPEVMQAEGETRIPTALLISGCILNLVFDPIFAFWLNFGVIGLSLANIFSSLIPFLVFVYLFFIKKSYVKCSIKDFKFSKKIVKEITKVFVPNFIDKSIFSCFALFTNFILIFVSGNFGVIVFSFYTQLRTIVTSPSYGGSRTVISIVGRLFGAKKIKSLKNFYLYSILCLSVLAFLSSLVCILFYGTFLDLYELTLSYSETLLVFFSIVISTIILSIVYVSAKTLDGMGKSMYSLAITLFKIVVDVILMVWFVYFTNLAWKATIYSSVFSEFLCIIVYILVIQYLIRKYQSKIDRNEEYI